MLNLHVHVNHWCRVELDVGRFDSPLQTRLSAVTNGWTDYSVFHSVIVERGGLMGVVVVKRECLPAAVHLIFSYGERKKKHVKEEVEASDVQVTCC